MSLTGSLKIASRRAPLVYLIKPYQMIRSMVQQGQPSPYRKHRLIRELAERTGNRIFIETGTYLGDTLWSLKDSFKELYSVELDRGLYEAACRRFARYKDIHLFCGDSAAILPKLLLPVKEPVLFWLDAHYSGGITTGDISQSPVIRELDYILSHQVKGHIVLIDDVASFGSDPAYPSLSVLKEYCIRRKPKSSMEVKDGIIVFFPEQ